MARFTTVPIEVDAVELTAPVRLGRQKGRAGDYLVTFPDGRQEIITAAAFELAYLSERNGAQDGRTDGHKPSGGRRPKAQGRRPAGSVSDEVKARAREQYAHGKSLAAIGRDAGVSGSAVALWAKAGKWKRPKPGAPDRAAAVAAPVAPPPPEPSGMKLSGRVRCTNAGCGQMTEWDPCEYCGRELERKKW